MKSNELGGMDYFSLGLLIFLALGMDIVVSFIDKLIWQDNIGMENFFSNQWYVLVVHWMIVIILWIIGGVLAYKWLKRRSNINDIISFEIRKDLLPMISLAIVASILITVFEWIISSQPLPQFYREFSSFYRNHGEVAFIVWIFQNIYYLVESMLVVLLLALMQKVGELWFKNTVFPFGGIGLLLTWGLGHLSKGLASCIWICLFCLIFGWLFVKAKRRWWPSLIFLFLQFII
ncbi:hypothetical protein SH1V18_47600 [Vallitalea longa]|uniref:Uncharacterized protein n=1 Tax=Vallitalea longa TaxID=2936439 RepID=A0A9W6DH42_9FIRM|nr:hypothetical protein [Vallitalea longa]GKX32280.1 hypothetical protein SH1V18_47600 [Vallitalea longa]